MEIYLDNGATTRVSPAAARRALEVMTEDYGNPSSLHRRGFLAEQALTGARQQLAEILRVRREEVWFTSGGSEGNNLAVLGGRWPPAAGAAGLSPPRWSTNRCWPRCGT